MVFNFLRRLTIKQEIFYIGITFSLVLLIIFGSLVSIYLYRVNISAMREFVKEKNTSLSIYTEGFFREIINTIEFLSTNNDVVYANISDQDGRERALALFDNIHGANDHIEYIYSGYPDGSLLINDYTPPEGFDSTKRPWYKSALAEAPNISTGVPFLEAATNVWVIAPSKVLLDDEGAVQGVVAIDCLIDNIVSLLSERYVFKTQRSFVLDEDGMIIIHSQEELIGEKIPQIYQGIKHSEGELVYSLQNRKVQSYYRKIPSTGWTIITAIDRSEIIRPIINQILYFLILVVLISVLIGYLLNLIFSTRFLRPLTELGNRVLAVTLGKTTNEREYRFSNYEIAEIADNIEKLAQDSLNKKATELNTIIESTNDAILVVDNSGKVIYSNTRFSRIFDIPKDKIDSYEHEKLLSKISQKIESSNYFVHKYTDLRNSEEFYTEELAFKDKKIFECFSCPFFYEKKFAGRLWSFLEITERKEAEESLKHYSRMQNLLINISTKYINVPVDKVDATINQSLAKICEFVNADRAYVYLYDQEKQKALLKNEYNSIQKKSYFHTLKAIDFKQIPELLNLHGKGETVFIKDTFSLPENSSLRLLLEQDSVKSMIAFPIRSDEHCLGFLGFDSVRRHYNYSDKEAIILELFSQLLINIWQRSSLEKTLIKMEQRNAVLAMSVTANHEINQPLMIIQGTIDLLKTKVDNPELDKFFNRLTESVQRIESILKKLNSLSKISLTEYADATSMINIDD